MQELALRPYQQGMREFAHATRVSEELLACGILKRDTLGPGLDRHALVWHHHVVGCVCHRLSFLEVNILRYEPGGSARN